MFFNLGENAGWQLLGWLLVFAGLVLANEFARRTKIGGITCFLVIPGLLTIYFVIVTACGLAGVEAFQGNWTYNHMNSWFHYAKLYAATAGCIGFMMIKYEWGIGKENWFKPFPFLIVAINILIAVASDFESGVRGLMNLYSTDATNVARGTRWWYSGEHVWLYGGWWNWVNGIAGLINIFCMTGWWGIYHSKDKKDMLWPDMTFVYIIAYDIWNFEYTYNNLPTHAWYCGLALLLAPTFANAFWNKGGWIQNRANTLAIWCMFAQVIPIFQDCSRFTTYSTLYPTDYTYEMMQAAVLPASANPTMQGVIAVIALIVNVVVLTIIIRNAIVNKKNPYKYEIFTYQGDFIKAMGRAELPEQA